MPTYYVDGAVGDDGNPGTSEGASNAWASIGKAMATVANGDVVYIKSTVTYSESGVSLITAALNASNYISFIGYTSTPGDNGRIVWDGSAGTSCLTSALVTTVYYYFANIEFINSSIHNVNLSGCSNVKFHNCEFSGAGGSGVLVDMDCSFVNCLVSANGSDGISGWTDVACVACVFANNAGDAYNVLSTRVVYRCLFYGGAASTQCIDAGGTESNVVACTFDGGGLAGTKAVQATSATRCVFVDNIMHDLDIGTDFAAAYSPFASIVGNNIASNTSPSHSESGVQVGFRTLFSSPQFTDEAGSDYTLSPASPAVGAGLLPGLTE